MEDLHSDNYKFGYLQAQCSDGITWKKKYFQIKDNFLFYAADEVVSIGIR